MDWKDDNLLCVIPARAGSTRIPFKNKREFHGKPIICYSIEKAKASGLFREIVVSTDDWDIMKIATDMGVTGEFRAINLCDNEVGTQRVGKYVVQSCRTGVATVCILYATAPLMSVQDLRQGFAMLRDGAQRQTKYVYSVDIFGHDVGQFYWCNAISLIAETPLDGPETEHIKISRMRACDINTMDDWSRAEEMYLALPSEGGTA